MPPRFWADRVRDIIDAGERVARYIEGMDFAQFSSDSRTVDAVTYNLTIVGEAACHVPADVVASNPTVPWRDMRDLRNFVVHGYFNVDAGSSVGHGEE